MRRIHILFLFHFHSRNLARLANSALNNNTQQINCMVQSLPCCIQGKIGEVIVIGRFVGALLRKLLNFVLELMSVFPIKPVDFPNEISKSSAPNRH